ncbi:MAG: hypothetical protein OdinLCB4_007030 [Candidatus Odinarchaeum yellowstonii]|uniref:Uncharacterized protein n=1 Tax=Odinarchaeota yellowstonii (strain LCB_4) TaxID=1841599 RepID=A0AAF0D1Z1_ODILC|nr:MAG: hypothetical protein OdinLCB4_007030 [Candidatus Odinarchaeum yellowstonii]
MLLLKNIVDSYMRKVEGLKEYCERCLRTERWGGSVVLMVVDAAFTSIGLNYFTAVVPKVELFSKRFVEPGLINCLNNLAEADIEILRSVWRNNRSWSIAKNIAAYLSSLGYSDREALRIWASNSTLEEWRGDPIGGIKGVGLVTYQYLRMMGGVDTVMPDKIVKRVINKIRLEAGLNPVTDDLEFIKETEKIAYQTNYRPIELCWMTWLIQSEGETIRMSKYAKLLPKI